MKKFNSTIFALVFFLALSKEVCSMEHLEEITNSEEQANTPKFLSPGASITNEDLSKQSTLKTKKKKRKKNRNRKKGELPTTGDATIIKTDNASIPSSSPGRSYVVNDSYEMTRQGNALIWKGNDDKSRAVESIISLEEFEAFNQHFTQIDAVPFDKSKAKEMDEDELRKLLEEHSKTPKFFSLIDGEGVFFEGNIRDKIVPYFVTGGVYNCVTMTLYGKSSGGRIFSSLVHIARGNNVDSIDNFLKPFLKFKEKHVTLRSHYKSETLLNVFNYIKNQKLCVNSVYVNDVHHSVKDDDISIIYHPKYFGKNNIDEIDNSQSILELVNSVAIQTRRPSSVILNAKTGKILEIPDSFILEARKTFEALRSPSLNSTEVFYDIKAYHITVD